MSETTRRFFASIDLNEKPVFDSNESAVYAGSLKRNRVCWDYRGRKMKVRNVSVGSVTVTRAGIPRIINDRSFTPRERLTIAPTSVVYLKNPTKTRRKSMH